MTQTPSPARPMRADAARNRGLLLDAAREAFSRQGVTASLDDVARSAGVGPATLYRHFPTRDHLVLAVIDEGLGQICDLGTALLDEPDALDALHRWLNAFIEQGSVFDGLARTLVSPPAAAPDDQSMCRLARGAGADLIARAADQTLIRRDVNVDDVLDMAAAIAWVSEQPDRDADQQRRLVRLLVSGLRPT
ncbi:MAG: Transcriptional regulator, TetR family [Mycobacterium sp.]|nr:Transcriptional regulator, TetR family [Mycobacterium sp.]